MIIDEPELASGSMTLRVCRCESGARNTGMRKRVATLVVRDVDSPLTRSPAHTASDVSCVRRVMKKEVAHD